MFRVLQFWTQQFWALQGLPIEQTGDAVNCSGPTPAHSRVSPTMDEQVTQQTLEELLSSAESLCIEFAQGAEARCIEEAIALDREALAMCTPGHPRRAYSLSILSDHLWRRYEQLGGVEIIEEAILLERDALELRPPGNEDRSTSLHSLAIYLHDRYRQLGQVEDLTEATNFSHQALLLCHPGHPNWSYMLCNLSNCLSDRYVQLGGADDLSFAIYFAREHLRLCSPGHPSRSISLNNLANRLNDRYLLLGGQQDLSEAIGLHREALKLRPSGHPLRSSSLNNLAGSLLGRYRKLGAVEDLNEAIDLYGEALKLCPQGHPMWSSSLSSLAICFNDRYLLLGELQDLSEAINLNRRALKLHPPGHPLQSSPLNNLASNLSNLYSKVGAIEDLSEAIDLRREALKLCPPGYLMRSRSLESLARDLAIRYLKLYNENDKEEMFSLFNELIGITRLVSSDDLSFSRAWIGAAEGFHHSSTILAYQTALQLLVQYLAALPSLPQNLAVLRNQSASLAINAFSACLRNKSPICAVEVLEQGRALSWNQLARLRSPLDDVVASGSRGRALANNYTRRTSRIRDALDSTGGDQHDRVWRLNVELEGTVSKIRELPGLSRFLLPSLFPNLQCAACNGPVIIVNASEYSCDALVVSVNSDPTHIPLTITEEGVHELASDLAKLLQTAKREDVTKPLRIFLRKLWDLVVSPIAASLHVMYPPRSRIWWCPTSEFSLLPLHAAAPYRDGQKGFSDLYISSYTPTLSALIRARRPVSALPASDLKRFVAIGQADAAGTDKLHTVGTELASIGQQMDGLTTFTSIGGQASCISRVMNELNENAWVHIACHGLAKRSEPFESGFALADGRLTIQRIIQCDLQHAEFAYLSACHTTVGDEESPDESLHLAAAMQFAGFRSVIGTMWAVDDEQANKITSVFYKHMVDESGRLDHTRAAYALWRATRSVKVPLDQRILYVHIGA